MHSIDTYKWVSVPREDLGWRVEMAINEAQIESDRAENARRPEGKCYDLQVLDPVTNLWHTMDWGLYDATIAYMYEDAV